MTVKVYCPHADCGQRYRVDETQLGQATVCKRCRRQFMLSASAVPPQLPPNGSDALAGPLEMASEKPSHDLPECLGRFQIRSRIGVGGFGTVYRAYDPVLDREVALKVPRAEVLRNPQARARFLREPKAAAQLRHPHIVPIYDAGSDGDHYYIASAYIEGQTLKDAVEDQQPDFRRLAQIVRDLAEALDYAHSMGVVHRDVKPTNVMIDARGQALLMDFGLAHLERSGEKLTQDGSVMGTPAYMAPEQADSSFGEVGSASDQYSLGVVLYELLCGETPFSGPVAAVIFNHLHQAPESPRRINPQVPKDLETVCLKAMAKQPNDRYVGCAALSEDLRRWLEGEPIRARQMGVAERLVRWCRRNPVVATLSLTTAILLVVVAIVTSVSAVRTSAALAGTEAERSRAEQERSRAEDKSREADQQRELAEQNAKEAQRQQKETEKARRDAETRLAELEKQKQETERERKVAEDAGLTARGERDKAKKASEEATSARQRAENNLAEAAYQRGRVEEHARLMRIQLYAYAMNHAIQALEEKDFDRVEQILERHIPKSGNDEDLRGFEWYYLANQCGLHGGAKAREPAVTLHHGSIVYRVEVAHDGSAFAAIGADETPRVWDTTTFRPRTPETPGPAVFQSAYLIGLRQWEQEAVGPLRHTGWNGCLPQVWSPGYAVRAVAQPMTPPIQYSFGGDLLAPIRRGQGMPSGLRQPAALGNMLATIKPNGGRDYTYVPFRQVMVEAADSRGKLWTQADSSEPLGFSANGNHLAMTKWQLALTKPWYNPSSRQEEKQYVGIRAQTEIWDVALQKKIASYDISWTEPVFSLLPADVGGGLAVIEPPCHFAFDGHGQLELQKDRPQKPTFQGRVSVMGSSQPRLQLSLFPDYIAFSSDGNVLVGYASNSQVAEIVDLKMGKTRRMEHLQGNRMTISPDGTLLATWYEAAAGAVKKPRPLPGTMAEAKGRLHKELDLHSNTAIELRNVADGHTRAILQGHKYTVRAVAFSCDGKTVATGSDDASIKLWDVVTGLEKCTLKGHSDGVLCLAFSNDGTVLASGSRDGTMRVWQAEPAVQRNR